MKRISHRKAGIWTLLAVLTLSLVAACGGGSTPTPTPPQQSGNTPQPTPTSAPPTPTATATPSALERGAEYFSGKTIEFIVPYNPGGGYDLIARAFALEAEAHFPGNPDVIVQNRPGSGALLGLQTVMRSAPDGLTAGSLHPRWIKAPLAGVEIDAQGFDPRTTPLVGGPQSSELSEMFCMNPDIAGTWDEVLALGREVTNGEVQPGGALGPEFIEFLGGPIRNVYGYSGGTSEIMQAFDRGELDGTSRCADYDVPRLYPQWLTDQRIAPVFWWGLPPDESYLEQMGISETPPYLLDLPGLGLTEEHEQAFEANKSLHSYEGVVTLPNGVEPYIVETWREGYKRTVESEGFRDRLIAAGFEPVYVSPDELQEIFRIVDGLSEEGLQTFIELAGDF